MASLDALPELEALNIVWYNELTLNFNEQCYSEPVLHRDNDNKSYRTLQGG